MMSVVCDICGKAITKKCVLVDCDDWESELPTLEPGHHIGEIFAFHVHHGKCHTALKRKIKRLLVATPDKSDG